MDGVTEYAEKYPVEICIEDPSNHNGLTEPRIGFRAYNEGRYNCTVIDAVELLTWMKKNRPDIWGSI